MPISVVLVSTVGGTGAIDVNSSRDALDIQAGHPDG